MVTKGEAWAVVDQEQDQNTTGVSDTVTFESTTSKTVTVSVSTDTSIYADITFKAVTVGVHQETATTVETSTTTAVGNTYAFTIPPKSVAYGIYGVKMDITTGHLTAKEPYNHSPCTSLTKDYGIVTANVPISKGWCVWLSGQKPCPTLS